SDRGFLLARSAIACRIDVNWSAADDREEVHMFPWSLVTSSCLSVLLFAQSAAVGRAQDRPAHGKIGMFVTADPTRAAPGTPTGQVEVEETASEVRKRAKGLDWIGIVDRRADADLLITVTGRRKDPSQGYVLSYILEAGEYTSTAEFSFEGGTEIGTGGIR